MEVHRDGPYYIMRYGERQQPYTVRRESGWKGDRHKSRDTTMSFHETEVDARTAVSRYLLTEA